MYIRRTRYCILLSTLLLLLLASTQSARAEIAQTRIYAPLIQKPSIQIEAPTPTPADELLSFEEQEVVRLTNELRAGSGCGAVQVVPELVAAARAHSEDMARNNFFSHTGSDGSSAGDRMLRNGYRWLHWGENIMAGAELGADAMLAWKASPPHLANMVECDFKDIGVAIGKDANGKVYWTQVFAKR